MTTTIELARDADGHVALTPEQAAAVARWITTVPQPYLDIAAACWTAGDSPQEALARYVLRAAAERERVADAMPDPAALDNAAAVLATVNDGTWQAAANDLSRAAACIRDLDAGADTTGDDDAK